MERKIQTGIRKQANQVKTNGHQAKVGHQKLAIVNRKVSTQNEEQNVPTD